MQTVRPSKGHIFAKPQEAVKKTASGILLAEEAAEKPEIAEIINVGKDVSYRPKDKIIYKPYTITEIKIDNEDYILVAEEDILGAIVEVDG